LAEHLVVLAHREMMMAAEKKAADSQQVNLRRAVQSLEPEASHIRVVKKVTRGGAERERRDVGH
jgi:hypothetical protein